MHFSHTRIFYFIYSYVCKFHFAIKRTTAKIVVKNWKVKSFLDILFMAKYRFCDFLLIAKDMNIKS